MILYQFLFVLLENEGDIKVILPKLDQVCTSNKHWEPGHHQVYEGISGPGVPQLSPWKIDVGKCFYDHGS